MIRLALFGTLSVATGATSSFILKNSADLFASAPIVEQMFSNTTDVISVEVFAGGLVTGYLSFRLTAESRQNIVNEPIGIYALDTLHRNLSLLGQVKDTASANRHKMAIADALIKDLNLKMKPIIIDRAAIESLAFDRRIAG